MTTAALVRTGEPVSQSVTAAESRKQLQLLRPIAQPAEIIKVQEETRQLIQETLKPGRDYGTIEGTNKPTLYKPGAERVALGFGCQYGEPIIVDSEIDHDREVKWSKKGQAAVSFGLYRYVLKVPVVELSSGKTVGWGAGAASTMESKYISRPRDCENTVFKMAAKRARIDACLTTFGLSEQFTQDVEDTASGEDDEDADLEEREPRTFTLQEALELPFPFTTHAKYGGKPLKDVSVHMLTVARDYLRKKIDEHGESADRVEPLTAVELVLQSKEGEKRADPTAGTSNGSSTSAPPTNGASSLSGARAQDTPPSARQTQSESFLDDDLDRYGEELPHNREQARREPNAPTPAKGAADSIFVLAKRLRTLIDHPKFPEEFRGTAKSDMSARVGKPNYEKWLQESVEAAEQYLRAQLEPKELAALGIEPKQ